MRRLLGPVVGVLVAVGGVLALLVFFSGRDDAGVPQARNGGPGRAQPDRGNRHLASSSGKDGACRPGVPTSGPHVVALPSRDGELLDDDQILSALERGNVVVLTVGRTPPPALLRLQRDVAGGPSDRALIREGGAVILGSRCSVPAGAVALAWRHVLGARGPQDPRLAKFADYWLGTTPTT